MTSRRRFLTQLGVGGAALSTIPLFSHEVARAGGGAYPARFVVYYMPNGTITDAWRPSGGERDFTLSRILRPLEPFRDRLVVLDGITQESSLHGPGNGHNNGGVGALTATELTADDPRSAGGISVDQEIAQAIGSATPFASVELGAYTGATAISYSGRNAPRPPEQEPREAIARLFDGLDSMSSSSPDAGRELRLRRQRILDVVSGEVRRVSAAVDREGREKLEAHLSALEDISTRLDDLDRVASAGTCATPPLSFSGDARAEENYVPVGQLNQRIAAAALACDLTRVVTLQWGRYGKGGRVPAVGINTADSYHDIGHDARGNAGARETVTRLWEEHCSVEFRTFLEHLDAVPEPTPESPDATMLDNTLVLWISSMSTPNHTYTNMPYVLAGGRNLGLDTGRFLQYSGTSHNPLLVSCCQLMGLTHIDRFGNPEYGAGPLPRL